MFELRMMECECAWRGTVGVRHCLIRADAKQRHYAAHRQT